MAGTTPTTGTNKLSRNDGNTIVLAVLRNDYDIDVMLCYQCGNQLIDAR